MPLSLPTPNHLPSSPSASTTTPQATTYHCTALRTCTLTTQTYESWLIHDLSAHPGAHNLWYCHNCPSLNAPAAVADCKLAFRNKVAFETHFFTLHPKDAIGNWRPPLHSDFHIGPDGPDGDGKGRLFWCGFCKLVLACSMTGVWEVDRFEHVAGHFMEGHVRLGHFEIGEWKWLEVEEAEVVQEGLGGGKAPAAAMVSEEKVGTVEGKGARDIAPKGAEGVGGERSAGKGRGRGSGKVGMLAEVVRRPVARNATVSRMLVSSVARGHSECGDGTTCERGFCESPA
jgi:hypothetical protein